MPLSWGWGVGLGEMLVVGARDLVIHFLSRICFISDKQYVSLTSCLSEPLRSTWPFPLQQIWEKPV